MICPVHLPRLGPTGARLAQLLELLRVEDRVAYHALLEGTLEVVDADTIRIEPIPAYRRVFQRPDVVTWLQGLAGRVGLVVEP